MGIYYCALIEEKKEYFESPNGKSIKSPGIFHPTNPFGQMIVMMMSLGYDVELINDMGYDGPYGDNAEEYKDITDEVYSKYLEYYPSIENESCQECKNEKVACVCMD